MAGVVGNRPPSLTGEVLVVVQARGEPHRRGAGGGPGKGRASRERCWRRVQVRAVVLERGEKGREAEGLLHRSSIVRPGPPRTSTRTRDEDDTESEISLNTKCTP